MFKMLILFEAEKICIINITFLTAFQHCHKPWPETPWKNYVSFEVPQLLHICIYVVSLLFDLSRGNSVDQAWGHRVAQSTPIAYRTWHIATRATAGIGHPSLEAFAELFHRAGMKLGGYEVAGSSFALQTSFPHILTTIIGHTRNPSIPVPKLRFLARNHDTRVSCFLYQSPGSCHLYTNRRPNDESAIPKGIYSASTVSKDL
jgi:hypothetical protein